MQMMQTMANGNSAWNHATYILLQIVEFVNYK